MSTIIDRRQNPKDKSLRNRQKFIQRSREQIKRAVKENINSGNIADIENGKARVKVKGISEPSFRTDPKLGNKKYILPGNKQHVVGDKQDKPQQDSASGNKAGLGKGEDDFEFVLNQEEFLDFIFEDLELPDLIKKQIKDVTKVKPKRAGFTNSGNPSQLDIVRSLKNSLGRRIGLKRPTKEELAQLEQELADAEAASNSDLVIELQEKIKLLKSRQKAIPWLDPFDVRYRNFNLMPQPTTQAVMLCIMDVSGSMGQVEKDLAKRFFFLLHMFLHRKYEKVEIVFIRHHEEASEVDEHTFFNSRESGGTVVSSALELASKIISKRYPVADWNIYVAQASDGDNYSQDEEKTISAVSSLLDIVQYFAYVEVRANFYSLFHKTSVWANYQHLVENYKNLHLRLVQEVGDVWKVFRELFSKEDA
jgi:uncharacterized sporulation protein YeaH/YhbH (DUF444 family)